MVHGLEERGFSSSTKRLRAPPPLAVVMPLALLVHNSCSPHREERREATVLDVPCLPSSAQQQPESAARPVPLKLTFERVLHQCGGPEDSSLDSDGSRFHLAEKGPRQVHRLLQRLDSNGDSALGVMMTPRLQSDDGMDKLMLDAFGRYGKRSDLLEFGRPATISFAIMLDFEFEAPSAGSRFIVFQLFQGAPYGPPLRMEIDSDLRARFYALDDSTGSNPCAASPDCVDQRSDATGVRELYTSAPLVRGEWTSIRIDITPRHQGMGAPGSLAIWVDDIFERPGFVGSEMIGYDPEGWGNYPHASVSGNEHPNAALDVSIGIYRSPQPRHQVVYFDDFVIERVVTPHVVGDSG